MKDESHAPHARPIRLSVIIVLTGAAGTVGILVHANISTAKCTAQYNVFFVYSVITSHLVAIPFFGQRLVFLWNNILVYFWRRPDAIDARIGRFLLFIW